MLDVFLALPLPQRGSFSVESTSSRAWRVGRSHDGFPAVLIAFEHETGESVPRRMASFSYAGPRAVEIVGADGISRAARLAILECRDPERALWPYFFRLIGVLLEGEHPTEAALESALDSLVTLFRGLQRPGLRTVQGLWAELAILLWSHEPAAMIAAWHSSSRALHDFAAGSMRLEVKSTTQQLREHHVRLEQLSAQDDGVTVVASLLLTASSAGTSVRDLVERLAQRLRGRPESLRRLEVIVAESLGDAWREEEEVRFDLDAANVSLRIYLGSELPTIPQPLPPEIKDVRFVLDLSSADALPVPVVRSLGALFASAFPPTNPAA